MHTGLETCVCHACENKKLEARVADLEKDSKRLDTLEKLLLDDARGRDFALQSDYEDGIWISEVLRGSLQTLALEHQEAHKTLRAAIDAISLKP